VGTNEGSCIDEALLRKAAERTIPALWDAIGRLIDLVTLQEAANYFAAAGSILPDRKTL
jgi:hypothetical protein